jgi:hypothetical protein
VSTPIDSPPEPSAEKDALIASLRAQIDDAVCHYITVSPSRGGVGGSIFSMPRARSTVAVRLVPAVTDRGRREAAT